MAQSDQVVQNATFPTVRSDINDNLAALFSQSSGNSAPTTTVAFQPWIDTGSSPALWKIRNAANTGWITVGSIDASSFAPGGVTTIANGGTGQTTASGAINALVPSQTGNSGKALVTNGTLVSWGIVAAGASVQTFTNSGTYTPTSGKTTFLVFCTGGGGGGGGAYTSSTTAAGGGGGGGGTGIRLYTSTELGTSATVTVGAAGAAGGGALPPTAGGAGGASSLAPTGTGLTLTGAGGSGGSAGNGSEGSGGAGGGSTNSLFAINGVDGQILSYSLRRTIAGNGSSDGGGRGHSFWGDGLGSGGNGGNRTSTGSSNGTAGTAGIVFILEW